MTLVSISKDTANVNGTYRTLHILRVVLPIDITRRRLGRHTQGRVPHLRRQSILEVKQARLAHVLDFGAGLADDGGFVAGAFAGVPAEDGEGPGAGAAGASKFLF